MMDPISPSSAGTPPNNTHSNSYSRWLALPATSNVCGGVDSVMSNASISSAADVLLATAHDAAAQIRSNGGGGGDGAVRRGLSRWCGWGERRLSHRGGMLLCVPECVRSFVGFYFFIFFFFPFSLRELIFLFHCFLLVGMVVPKPFAVKNYNKSGIWQSLLL